MDEKNIFKQYYEIVNQTNIVSKTDIYGIITYVNDKFIEISGYTKKELIGNPHSMIRDPDLPSSLFKELWDTIQAKKSWHGIITNLKKNGTKYTVEASIFPILDNNNEIIEYIAIRHDISNMVHLHKQLELLYQEQFKQELLAQKKLESGIINDLSEHECQIFYYPHDTLSGDFYSLYKREDGSIFIYLMDGQGHGASPALTVFAISSMIKNSIYESDSLEKIMQKLYPSVRNFLADNEQLSYTMIMISPQKTKISYSSAGMYPFYIKYEDQLLKIKSNNTPFMNFSPIPKVEYLEINNWQSLFLYSDGLKEHTHDELAHYSPENLISNASLLSEAQVKLKSYTFDDDVTFLKIDNI